MKSVRLAILLAFIFIGAKIFANDEPPFYIQQLDNRNGLSNSAINALFSDSDNLLWIATWDGLNLYDGTSFHVFNYSKENNTASIGNNVVQQILQDKNGFIWISTIEGLSRYSKHSGTFANYFYTHSTRLGISEREYALLNDSSKNIYCLTRQHGLLFYDLKRDSFVTCKVPFPDIKISRAIFDDANRLWLLRQNGTLEVYAVNNDQYTLLRQFRNTNNFFISNDKIFYTTATKELFAIDATLKANFIAQFPNTIKAITFYKDHFLVAWSTHGFAVYDQNFQPSYFMKEEVISLQNTKITSWESGTEQILWCGTDGNGLIKIFPEQKYFGSVNSTGNTQAFNKSVRAFCENGNTLWVGTKGNGIISLPKFNATSTSQNIAPEKPFAGELDNNNVFALYKGIDNLIYIGTDAKGISVYDPLRKALINWDNITGSDELPSFASVYAIVQDEDSSVWLGTSGYGLIHISLQRKNEKLAVKHFEQYVFDGTSKGPANDIIYALEHGSENKLWVGCRYGGLNLFDKKEKIFRIFKAFSYEGSLSHNDVLALYKDQRNRVWIGTSYGLNWINESNINSPQPYFTKITTADGLPNNTIHAITEDNDQHIWISTNKGLVKINPETLAISQFQQKDGLQSNEFCDGAVWKNANGVLFFGGIFGFNYFEPNKIQLNTRFPNLLITGLQPGSKATDETGLYVLKPNENSSLQYTLSRRENFFELQLRALSFSNAEKCEYAYYLEGYDKKWHYSGSDGKISYSNITPGKYTFKVKWSNGDGVWTNETTLFPLTIKQYFWLTWPAFALYALLISSGAIIFGLYKRSQFKMRMQLQMEHALRTKEEEVHNEKMSFFTNIAHELQTPLTLIVGASEQNMQQKDDPYFKSLLHQQASRLTYLVQQLMDFRKAENGFLKKQFVFIDISSFTKNITSLFIPIAKQKAMKYNMAIDENIEGWVDKDKLEKMLFNLLSNAFKHSPRNEEVDVDIQQNITTKTLNVTITNTGCHIPADQLDKVFHRFFTSGTSSQEKFSSGIGLAFTRQLAELLDGSITVSSENNYVKFCLILPLPETVDAASIIETEQSKSLAPSYLLQSIVASAEEKMQPAVANNKMATLEHIENDNKQSVLIVDDEMPIRSLIREVIGHLYIVYEADNGTEALEFMRQTQPDCIISDVMMPDMNGLEFCEKIKEAPATCHIPFILLSARGATEQKTEGYEAGADAYIAKPFHTEYLLVRIRKLLEYRKRMHDIFKKDNIYYEIEEEEIVDEDKTFLKNLVRFIEENIDDEKLGPEQLEKHMCMSKMNFYRKIKALSNMTPAEFIRHIRLKEAARLLTTTQLTVSEIFYKTGFNNQSYFFREFKKLYQCSPNEYRVTQTNIGG